MTPQFAARAAVALHAATDPSESLADPDVHSACVGWIESIKLSTEHSKQCEPPSLPTQAAAIAYGGILLWWHMQTDPNKLLKQLARIDLRSAGLALCICARWVLERHWYDDADRRPWIAVEITEAWWQGKATDDQVHAARDEAWKASDDMQDMATIIGIDDADPADVRKAAKAAAAVQAALAAGYTASFALVPEFTNASKNEAKTYTILAVTEEAVAAEATGPTPDALAKAPLRTLNILCDLIREHIECPRSDVWLAETKRAQAFDLCNDSRKCAVPDCKRMGSS